MEILVDLDLVHQITCMFQIMCVSHVLELLSTLIIKESIVCQCVAVTNTFSLLMDSRYVVVRYSVVAGNYILLLKGHLFHYHVLLVLT
jgi:hypothetical protein